MKPPSLASRINDSPVFWSWAFNFCRLAAGVLLLPLLLRKLSEPDLGMHYVFLGLASLVPILDNAFSFNIARFVGYALGGARELKAQGVSDPPQAAEPNYPLVWELLEASRALYLRIAAGVMAALGLAGWLIIRDRMGETSDPTLAWWAAGAALVAAGAEIYSSWWNAFLRGMNQVRDGARIATFGYLTKLVLACALLLAGFGLAAVPTAGIVGALLQRTLSRRRCLELLPSDQKPEGGVSIGDYLRLIWPNSWRVGLQLISGYLAFNAVSALCLHRLGLEVNAQLGLSWQVLMLIQGVSAVWTQVAWPKVAQHRARHEREAITRELAPRLRLQLATYLVLAGALLLVGQQLLDWIARGKKLLPSPWLAAMALNVFLEMHFSFWGSLLASENRVPSLWPTVWTNLLGVVAGFVLLTHWRPGIESLIVGPLVVGCLFNYWYWAIAGARNLGLSYPGFLFARSRIEDERENG